MGVEGGLDGLPKNDIHHLVKKMPEPPGHPADPCEFREEQRKVMDAAQADRLHVQGEPGNVVQLRKAGCSKGESGRDDEVDGACDLFQGILISGQCVQHAFDHGLRSALGMPEQRIAGELQEILLGAQGSPGKASAVGQVAIVWREEKFRTVSTRRHTLRDPKERVDVAFAAEGNEKNPERHEGKTLTARSPAFN